MQEPVSRAVSEYVFRGEVMEPESYQRGYRPRLNQQIAPQNRSAIDSYQSTGRVGAENRILGLILDSYI